MNRTCCTSIIVSSFNVSNFARLLQKDENRPQIEILEEFYGSVVHFFKKEVKKSRQTKADLAVIWTKPEDVIPSFRKQLEGERIELEDVIREVDEFCDFMMLLDQRARFVCIPTWVDSVQRRGNGMLAMKTGVGTANTLMRMNLRLAEHIEKQNNFIVLDAQRWMAVCGRNAVVPALWYMAKIPFSQDVFIEAVKDIKAAMMGFTGKAKKLVVIDLDETIWGNIVGDVGWENLNLGGHDHIGEAFVDFQKTLKALKRRGILLGIISKNEENVALEAIEKHPEMILREKDFAGWRINWDDKAKNLAELVSDLNLGLESVVFIDDNPVERARVREAFPEVLVPEMPNDKMLYKNTLLGLRCFDIPAVVTEDIKRADMYAAERKRKDLEKRTGSITEWLETLDMKIKVEVLNHSNLKRVIQLLNKTNQMNLATRRLSEIELVEWEENGDRFIWTFRVSDRFGDSGLTGIASLDIKETSGRIVDFILSCRVMGRGVEDAMLYVLLKYAQDNGLKEVLAEYLPTQKNVPCLRFFEQTGLLKKDNIFYWQKGNALYLPKHVNIEYLKHLPA